MSVLSSLCHLSFSFASHLPLQGVAAQLALGQYPLFHTATCRSLRAVGSTAGQMMPNHPPLRSRNGIAHHQQTLFLSSYSFSVLLLFVVVAAVEEFWYVVRTLLW